MAIANALKLEAARATPVLSHVTCDAMPSLNSLNLSVAVVLAGDTLLCAVTLTSYPVTLTFDPWPWTFAVCRMRCDETLYQIWTQSSNPRGNYCEFNIWPNDLEHVSSVAFGSGYKFDLWQLIRAWIIAFYADMLCHAVTLTFDLLTLNFYSISGVM